MKAKIYDHEGIVYNIDLGNIPNEVITPDLPYMDGDYLNIFTNSHRVPDVWRYTVIKKEELINIISIKKSIPISNYNDRLAIDAIGTRIIQLILESPHTSEYTHDLKPKGPAQGRGLADAGGAIERYLIILIRKLNLHDGYFSLVISNPIPYMCSLGIFYNKLNAKLRDTVWKKIWDLPSISQDFINRTKTYQPEYVINCCTRELQPYVTKVLENAGLKGKLFEAPHPSVNWNINQENIRVVKLR